MSEEKRKGFFTVMIVCLLIFAAFGFRKNSVATPESDDGNAPKSTTSAPRTVSGSAHAAKSSYLLRLEDGFLNLYLNSDEDIIFLESFAVNEALYPAADITELERGITLDRLEKCIGIIEDFTS